MPTVGEHVSEYKKAYAAGGTALVTQPIAEHASVVLMWLIELSGAVMPAAVQTSVKYLIVAIVTGFVVKFVSNTEPPK